MKLLIINNHDSFTFNLVDLIRKLNVPYDVLNVEDLKESTAEKYSHILISPGPDVPRAYPQLFFYVGKILSAEIYFRCMFRASNLM